MKNVSKFKIFGGGWPPIGYGTENYCNFLVIKITAWIDKFIFTKVYKEDK